MGAVQAGDHVPGGQTRQLISKVGGFGGAEVKLGSGSWGHLILNEDKQKLLGHVMGFQQGRF